VKHSALPRLLPWLLIAVCPPLLGRCGGAAEQGAETGNRVTVSNGGGSQTVPVGAPTSGDTADAGESAPAGTCTAVWQTLAARASAGFANVDTTCQRDEQCVFASTGSACYSSCPSVVASRSGAQAVARAVEQEIAPLCDEFESQHCETPALTCVEGYPVLVCQGTCTYVSALRCDQLPALTAARLTTVINDASRSCSRDEDCALAQAAIRCVPSCGNLQSVASSAREALQRSVAETEGLYCGAAESLGCPGEPQLPCTPSLETPRATCNAGQCEIAFVPVP